MLNDEMKGALGVALNEASLLGFELDPARALGAATFSVLSLPADGGSMPADARVQLLFHGVCRLAVSLRDGRWDDPTASVLPVTIDGLLGAVQSFGGLPVYGWEFFDTGERELTSWGDRLSLDWHAPNESIAAHSFCMFQEGNNRHLDICVWFEEIEARRPDGTDASLEDVAAVGRRWWDAFYAHDPRTQGLGMAPLSDG